MPLSRPGAVPCCPQQFTPGVGKILKMADRSPHFYYLMNKINDRAAGPLVFSYGSDCSTYGILPGAKW
jgi:hypothetical protein